MYRLGYLTYLFMVSSAGVTFVFLEDIESDYGISALGIGAISSITFFVTLVGVPLVSPLGDRGLLKFVGWAGFITTIAGNLWIGFATDLWSILGSRGLIAFGTGLFGVAVRKALVGESLDGSAEKLGMLLSAAVAGFIAGPGVGAWLAELGDITTPYLVVAVALILLMVPTMRWMTSAPVATSNVGAASLLPLLRRRRIRGAIAAQSAVFFNIGVFDSTVDEYLTDLGVSNTQVGLILIIVGAPLLVIPRLAGRAADTSATPERILLVAFMIFVPIVLTISLWAALIAFVIFATLQTATESVIFPSAVRVVLDETGAEESAIGQSLLDGSSQFAAGVSAFLAPTVYDFTDGPLGPFGTSACVALCLLTYSATQFRGSHQVEFVV